VIGINAFIFTQTGGSIGLGFAIPINLARRVVGEIKAYGRVRAAYPGMGVQPLTPRGWHGGWATRAKAVWW
jgi:S1-C subfamily serine protease